MRDASQGELVNAVLYTLFNTSFLFNKAQQCDKPQLDLEQPTRANKDDMRHVRNVQEQVGNAYHWLGNTL